MGHTFASHALVMTNVVHNAVIKTLSEGASQGYAGPCYQQPGQMSFASNGSTVPIPSSFVPGQSEGDGSSAIPQPINATLTPQLNPIFTNSSPITKSVQGGPISGSPLGWNPVAGFGMPPGSFTLSTSGQKDVSASQPMVLQLDGSAPQPMAQGVSVSLPITQGNALASQPMAQQQHIS